MKLKQSYNWMLVQLAFAVGIIAREVFMLITLSFLVTMVLYHAFPEGWFPAVVNQMKNARKAYNDAFIETFQFAVKKFLKIQ